MTVSTIPHHRLLSAMRRFDPVLVARYEKDSWVAYYQRQWFTLLRLLIGLVRSTSGLSVWQAIRVRSLLLYPLRFNLRPG